MTASSKLSRLFVESMHVPGALRLIWHAARLWTVAWVGLLVVQALLPLATVLISRDFIDQLTIAVTRHGEWAAARPVLIYATALAVVLLLDQVAASAARWLSAVQTDHIQDYIAGLIQQKSIEVDLSFYESPDFYDRLYRARDESGNQAVALLDGLGSLLRAVLTLVAMIGVLLPYGPWLALALIGSTIPALLAAVRHTRIEHRWWLDHTEEIRRGWYYDWMLITAANAAEIRLFGLGERFRSSYESLRARLRHERMQWMRNRAADEVRVGMIAVAANGVAGLWLLVRALEGKLTLGDLALAYQAFQQGQSLMRALLGSAGHLYSTVLFLGGLFDFLTMPSELARPAAGAAKQVELAGGIRFEAVSFRYPQSDRMALENFDLELPAGRVIAIVGANGAGKSTVVKLLCRFYDPERGRITCGGVDVRELDVAELRHSISAIFQAPIRYAATVADNIAYGDIATGAERARVEAAAAAAGAEELIRRLPRGYDTKLGTLFAGGTELSAGEWQRLALARAFFRAAPILLLDEPTSAMDSWAEADWLRRFRSLISGRTTLIITHRLSTAMHADMIHVMADGRIVESGAHDELIARHGQYAASWAAQKRA